MKRKKRSKKREVHTIVSGIGWYSREQWAELRDVVSDPEELESTYDEWLDAVKAAVPDLIKVGGKLLKVPVDVSELVSWCRQRRKRINAAARAEYILEMMQERGASSFETITTQI